MTTINEALKPLATPAQWDAYLAYCTQGSYGLAAKHLSYVNKRKIAKATVAEHVKRLLRKGVQQGVLPPALVPVPEGLTLKGTSTLYREDGSVKQQWEKTKVQGLPVEETVQLPDPKKITKVSTLYDNQGQVTQQWVSEKPEDKAKEALWQMYAKELAAEIVRAEPTPAKEQHFAGDLLAAYPVGDHHLGMLAWGTETGSDSYDMKISEQLLRQASTRLMSMSPPCKQALITFLGDFLHYDSFETVTPTSHNLLDADGRFPKMVRTGVRMMRHMISAALDYHERVHVIVEIGNHDLSSSVFLMECLRSIYENEPRVTVDTLPSHYHYFEFGKVLIGTHHGHGSKLERLPMIMAADQSEAWGRTAHRYWWTGHIHNRTVHEYQGCSVESFNILAPVDAWAAQKGYRPVRNMKALVLHREHGEVARHIVNPQMFKGE